MYKAMLYQHAATCAEHNGLTIYFILFYIYIGFSVKFKVFLFSFMTIKITILFVLHTT